MKEESRLLKGESRQNPPGKIIRLEFNDWSPKFHSEKCDKLVDWNENDISNLPFEVNFEPIDQSCDWLVSTTEEDLRENGYEELLEDKYRYDPISSVYDLSDFPSYKNPKLKKNGKN